jgi:cytochrome c556
MDAMGEMGDASKVIGDMVKRKRPFDLPRVQQLARELAEHAAKIPGLFPDSEPSRNGTGTEAVPSIWQRWPEFQDLAMRMQRTAHALSDITDEAELRREFIDVFRTCLGCHARFRKKTGH